jgi:hypothetical protein
VTLHWVLATSLKAARASLGHRGCEMSGNADADATRRQDIAHNPTLRVPVLDWKVLRLVKHVQRLVLV